MNDTDPFQLLQRYLEHGSEEAFRELTARYVDFVYSVACRRTRGDSGLAQDIVQMVFADLACKAGEIGDPARLGGWLHRHTCFVSSNLLRSERRRRAREEEAAFMNQLQSNQDSTWDDLAPELDLAIDRLNPPERAAIIQRFFEQRSFREMGLHAGATEDAMHKRVSRALDRLRRILDGQGATLSAATLTTLLAGHAVQAAPAGLAVAVGATTLTGWTLSSTATATTTTLLNAMNVKLIATGAVLLVGATAVTMLIKSSSDEGPGTQEMVREPVVTMEADDRIITSAIPAQTRPTANDQHAKLLSSTNGSGVAKAVPESLPELGSESPEKQEPEAPNPSPAFTAPVQARLQSGQTLVTGGWRIAPGRLAFVFVTPEANPAAGTVMTRSTIMEVPEELWLQLGLQEFVSEDSQSTLNNVIDGPEASVFLQALRETEGVHVLSSPAINALDGQTGSISVGQAQGDQIFLELQSTMSHDGRELEMAVTPKYMVAAP